ncbi:aliphatic sulfonate ABC transporter substrate-binding protein [Beijerinckia indica]|uniref:Putative aliphatic sulfonates-binding protein n=1 Tax=Beijerinckia indica subsp. indica (strain ATCC 9039 / DSM 1715 / NCIMB 8712) TaxID=395963 RepID=B2II93_BEII9|nr:aliphatic sulfonate ABC transporter substrate-binding protein [Beijerinckia indica]ACB96047.1 aliphatic sulfonates family ABC transporter, periplsmic ligand-binding protein [Beijerinckia indica subsp. indica ATCC 9039]
MRRRDFLGLALAGGALASLPARGAKAAANGSSAIKEIRIGYQKAGLLVAVKQRGTLEAYFNPHGIEIKWAEFAFGPPILEGIGTGNLDFGYTGDAPPIFAQAAGANLVYTSALPKHYFEAVLVPEDSPIRTLADLKGKRIGLAKASSAHTTILAALEKAGISYQDIKPVYLPPADAAAAFSRGNIDVWAIWDPYAALAQQQGKVRLLTSGAEVHEPSQFFLANGRFAQEHPDVLNQLNDRLAEEIKWASTHQDALSDLIHAANGIDLAAIRLANQRAHYDIFPISEETIVNQQKAADRFYKVGLLPKPVSVRDIVWKWTPGA